MIKGNMFKVLIVFLVSISFLMMGQLSAKEIEKLVQVGKVVKVNNYVQKITYKAPDGKLIDKHVINGPSKRPAGFGDAIVDSASLDAASAFGYISNVPAYEWSFGCSATAAAIIAAYWDRNGFPNIYTGPTNGGVMPLDNSSWGYWQDSVGDWQAQCPLSATRNGLDGRTINGHVDDYWISYQSSDDDPFYGNWIEHTYGDCTGDYMKTNQTTYYYNSDGSTAFYTFTSSGDPLTAAMMEAYGIWWRDGAYGFKQFYESRGYDVEECYNQKIFELMGDNGFTFENYMAQIDAGNPIFIHIEGHTMVGVGYDSDTTTRIIYLRDTWDYNLHRMAWGGSYQGMAHLSVSVVKLANPALEVTSPNGGETCYLGRTANITWDATSIPGKVKISLWKGGVKEGNIATVDAANGSYSWTVGNYIGGTAGVGADYTIKIKEVGTAVADVSDANFTIAAPSVTVTAPNGAETWTKGNSQNITWNTAGPVGNLKITLWKGGVFVGIIANNIDSSAGAYSWTVGNYAGGTAVAGADYTIKIKEKGTSVADSSDANFSILNPTITVTSPNGGENWTIGADGAITWTNTGPLGNLKITLWKGGTLIGVIANNVPSASGTYSWTYGDYIGGTAAPGIDYRVKIKEIGASVSDISDADFTLAN